MTSKVFFEIHSGLPREGPGRDIYTQRAFEMIPPLDAPRILDVGCGPGGPTMEIARLSGGSVTGLDNHQPYLDELRHKIGEAGVSDRVDTILGSMFDMDFPEHSFDIIWAEGSIYIAGFDNGLRSWKRFLKQGGYMAVHEMTWLKPDPPAEIEDYWRQEYPGIRSVEENLEAIERCGYRLIEHFPLPDDAWWEEYYSPLAERLVELRKKYRDDSDALKVIEEEQREIDLYRKYSEWYGSTFFVMQESGSTTGGL